MDIMYYQFTKSPYQESLKVLEADIQHPNPLWCLVIVWFLISLMFLGVKVRKQIVLDGPVGCGKSITLAMLVHLARHEGWLVLYVPQGQDFVLDAD
ncbi:hypothetical protein K2173_002949 [Erythroxylum novogranatense]|uniref:Small ribosomal subunit protein mS29 n=1 Tax=Erythroxylum novogranatense TaxID=1862640 RepID=A0AAV8TTQ8_9ROSI|nr:hypothetical protein K2173_002949 [Erythroxylum novogranatense]